MDLQQIASLFSLKISSQIKPAKFEKFTTEHISDQKTVSVAKSKNLQVRIGDFSQAEKERTACKAEQIHKMTTIFTQNGPRLSF